MNNSINVLKPSEIDPFRNFVNSIDNNSELYDFVLEHGYYHAFKIHNKKSLCKTHSTTCEGHVGLGTLVPNIDHSDIQSDLFNFQKFKKNHVKSVVNSSSSVHNKCSQHFQENAVCIPKMG